MAFEFVAAKTNCPQGTLCWSQNRQQTEYGSVAEWSIAPVLKTGNGQPFVSSNLTASAKLQGFGACEIAHGARQQLTESPGTRCIERA